MLATNNVNFENLLPDVTAAGGNLVNGAWRPGVDKITFVLHPTNALSGAFVPSTNFYTDHFFTNGVLISQPVVRIVSQPDILFSVTDFDDYYSDLQVARTGTTNWLNLAELNGRPAGAGPGIIRPPILIAFNKAGIKYFRDGIYYGAYEDYHFQWASYDFSISSLEVYPQTLLATNQTNIRMQLAFGDWPYRLRQKFLWSAGGAVGTVYQFQTTTDLVNWAGLFSVTNDGSVCRFFDNVSDTSARAFYRLVPQ